MIEIMICGAGNIGSAVASLLSAEVDYHIHLADLDFSVSALEPLLQTQANIKTVALDVKDESSTMQYVSQHAIQAIISCTPSELNPYIAAVAKEMRLHYFDLGENEDILKIIQAIAEYAETAFVPNCGLAPGLVGMIAHELINAVEQCHSAHICVGTLLSEPTSAFDCAADCSVDRIINQYTNDCTVIQDSCITTLPALSGIEPLVIDSKAFEAFYTSGCMGGLPALVSNTLQQLDYKSIHFPGYAEKFNFLMHDLKLQQKPELLKAILQDAKATSKADQVILQITVSGRCNHKPETRRYKKRLLPTTINGMALSATQASTAVGVAAVVDYVLSQPHKKQGLVVQETFPVQAILSNRFASYFGKELDCEILH